MNKKAALLISALAVVSVASCTTIEYVPITPTCTAPPNPVLPEIDRGELWDALGDKEYRQIETYITRLWAYTDEQSAILSELCD